ncbi:hypothetical protein [Sphingomonas sp.]|jgi:hypothetical protein|uniref:hypothetical protein n=1 Tax=Sphingomonas sp. TaxID=28214 RepID=UPI00260532A8|nr:hypothetical protein [Sphingomonas sp.]MDF2495583.1 hypothetical protein [Sphingomonas sp.]
MTAAEKIQLFSALAPVIATVGVAAMLGWVATTWMRIRNGYPLDGQWGQALYPKRDDETIERVKLLTQENGQLRAELGSMKDRLQNVERIVTDSGHMVAQEIEQLRDRAN